MNTQFEREAFKVGLRKLLDPQRHFSICDFDNLCKASGVTVSTAERDTLSLLHCVSYGDMRREMKEGLIAQLSEIFSRARDPIANAAAALEGAVARASGGGISQSEFLKLVK